MLKTTSFFWNLIQIYKNFWISEHLSNFFQVQRGKYDEPESAEHFSIDSNHRFCQLVRAILLPEAGHAEAAGVLVCDLKQFDFAGVYHVGELHHRWLTRFIGQPRRWVMTLFLIHYHIET